MSAIQKQQWHNDKAFKMCMTRKQEKGFKDMQDYLKRSKAYRADVTKSREGKSLDGGERRSVKFAILIALNQLKPVIYIVGFIFLIWFTLSNHFFLPVSENSVFIARSPTSVATAIPVTTPTPKLGNTQITVSIDNPAKKSIDIRSIGSTVALSISILLFFFMMVRKIIRGKRGKIPAVHKEAEAEDAGSVE